MCGVCWVVDCVYGRELEAEELGTRDRIELGTAVLNLFYFRVCSTDLSSYVALI